MTHESEKDQGGGKGPVSVVEPGLELAAKLMEASIGQTFDITNRLVDSLTEQVAEANATLDAIRAVVTGLLSGDVMPTPRAIERALWPSDALIARFREQGARR